MYNIIKTAILSGGYKLAEMQKKINKLWIGGHITEAEADDLLILASGGIDTDAERPEMLAIVKSLSEKIDALTERVAYLEGVADGFAPEEPGGTAPDVYENWEPWDGISEKYKHGTIVYHNGKTWISTFKGQNVWEPGTPGTETLWAEYIDDNSAAE